MRFPVSSKALYYYIELLGPGDPGVPESAGGRPPPHGDRARGPEDYAETAEDLPAVLSVRSRTPGRPAVQRRRQFTEMQQAIRARDTDPDQGTVELNASGVLDEESFYGFIAGQRGSFKQAGFAHREAFGQVGFGTGGWDTDFPNSILEILRVVYTDADDRAPRITGGAARLPRHSGSTRRRAWHTGPSGTSLASLHAGARAGRRGPGYARERQRFDFRVTRTVGP